MIWRHCSYLLKLNHNKTYVIKKLLFLLAFIKTTTVKIKLKLENKDLIPKIFVFKWKRNYVCSRQDRTKFMWFLIHCALNKEHLKSEFSFSREGAKIEMLAGGSSFILYVLYYVAVNRFYLEWELIIFKSTYQFTQLNFSKLRISNAEIFSIVLESNDRNLVGMAHFLSWEKFLKMAILFHESPMIPFVMK